MQGGVRMVGFSWDGSFVAGASDEGNGIEIVSLCSFLSRGVLLDLYPSFPLRAWSSEVQSRIIH